METYRKIETKFLQLLIYTDEENNEIAIVDEDERCVIFGLRLSEDPQGKLLEYVAYAMDNLVGYHFNQGFDKGMEEGRRQRQSEVAYTLRKLMDIHRMTNSQ
jgi:hypothetical protein